MLCCTSSILRKIKITLAVTCLSLTCTFTSLASEYISVGEQYSKMGIVECPKFLNIRQQPTTESAIVGIIPNGGVVEVKRTGDLWHAVKSGDISGYVLKEYLVTGAKAESLAEQCSIKKIRFNSIGSIYAAKNKSSKVWDRPITGSTYNVIEDTGDWVTIDLDSAIGYISKDEDITYYMGLETAMPYYNVSNVSEQRKDVIKYAMQFLGKPYVWGGNDPNTGADCSGFVRYCYWHSAEVWLPRVSYEQCNVGELRTSMEMLPGDLIYYANQEGTVGHVAMYIGNGTILHAASKASGVKLSQWNYRTPKYIRSVLPD